jgi:hypothetical protein
MRKLLSLVAVSFVIVVCAACQKKMGPGCTKLDACCKASSADKCPSDMSGLDEASCQDRLDMVKQELAAAKKPLPAACAP